MKTHWCVDEFNKFPNTVLYTIAIYIFLNNVGYIILHHCFQPWTLLIFHPGVWENNNYYYIHFHLCTAKTLIDKKFSELEW